MVRGLADEKNTPLRVLAMGKNIFFSISDGAGASTPNCFRYWYSTCGSSCHQPPCRCCCSRPMHSLGGSRGPPQPPAVSTPQAFLLLTLLRYPLQPLLPSQDFLFSTCSSSCHKPPCWCCSPHSLGGSRGPPAPPAVSPPHACLVPTLLRYPLQPLLPSSRASL